MLNPKVTEGTVAWRSPSNIAIVKYWGKHGRQLPANPSISLSLSASHTDTEVQFSYQEAQDTCQVAFTFEGKPAPDFAARIEKYLHSITDLCPFLPKLSLKIDSSNSFPHSAGIASSASAMSALALCLCSIEKALLGTLLDDKAFFKKASELARLGSGSACRSTFGRIVSWGQHSQIEDSSDLFGTPIRLTEESQFHSMLDSILIISGDKKSVSSTAGHGLMASHPFAETRYKQANHNCSTLLDALKNDDIESFGQILEEEALTLHGLMMNSSPSFILMKPNTLKAIELIRALRESEQIPWHFTLDAGPNVHLLYPKRVEARARELIDTHLKPLCEDGRIIWDSVGQGPEKLG